MGQRITRLTLAGSIDLCCFAWQWLKNKEDRGSFVALFCHIYIVEVESIPLRHTANAGQLPSPCGSRSCSSGGRSSAGATRYVDQDGQSCYGLRRGDRRQDSDGCVRHSTYVRRNCQ